MFYTPRFSWDTSETVICACPVVPRTVVYPCCRDVRCLAGCTRVGIQVGTWEGYTGYYPASLKAEGMTAERAPEGLQGLEWVVIPAAPAQPSTHPSGPVGPTRGPSLVEDWAPRANPASGLIGRDLGQYSVKLVKTWKCHQKVCKRPPIVPIYKTGSKCHLLKF